MPTSGPVYQPTTVSYEQQSEWSQPGSFLSQSLANNCLRNTKFLHWFPLGLGAFAFLGGLIMVIEGSVSLASEGDALPLPPQPDDDGPPKTDQTPSSGGGLALTIVGALLMAFGMVLLGIYARYIRRHKGCPCFPSKEERLARQLDTQASNGQILTLNPSTDLLVTAQYGPVSEIAYQPPIVSEQEETHKLMASDNKECNEESERMLESDPRIVLRPLSHNEEA